MVIIGRGQPVPLALVSTSASLATSPAQCTQNATMRAETLTIASLTSATCVSYWQKAFETFCEILFLWLSTFIEQKTKSGKKTQTKRNKATNTRIKFYPVAHLQRLIYFQKFESLRICTFIWCMYHAASMINSVKITFHISSITLYKLSFTN